MDKIKIGIIGLGHAFEKQLKALESINEIKLMALCDSKKEVLENCKLKTFKTTDYKKLINCDYVLISSPPITHFKIAKFFIKNKINIIIEKPIFISIKQLNKIVKLVKRYKVNFYNTLHFSFGLEICNYLSGKEPIKIKALITDKYVDDEHIKKDSLSLHGSYLDETINPLSAISRIYNSKIKFLSFIRKKFRFEKYDYYSVSKFEIEKDNKKIPIIIEVDWNRNTDDKYIDLFFEDETIRLDSKEQKVINLNTNEILFSGYGDRMTNHYTNVFNDFLKCRDNLEKSFNIHKCLLEKL